MTKEDAEQLSKLLVESGVPAEAFSDLNLWCVRIRWNGSVDYWCSVIGDSNSMTWGPMWEFNFRHHDDLNKLATKIARTIPKRPRTLRPSRKATF